MAHRASVASPATRVDVDTCHRGIFRVRAARGARRAVHGEACTRAARRGVVEDGGRWAGGAGKEHDAALRASLAEKVQELAAEAGPLTNTILRFVTVIAYLAVQRVLPDRTLLYTLRQ